MDVINDYNFPLAMMYSIILAFKAIPEKILHMVT